MTPDPGFKVTVVLKGEYLENRAFYTQSYYKTVIGNHMHAIDRQANYTAYQPHCSYVNCANFSQASRGFVSDSWAFLYVCPDYLAIYFCNLQTK